jgi:TetR/AcrR family transcriptional regulator, transcriptional repressor for nem operon
MTARSERGEETRQRIIQVAADLFHRQGVAATSPDEITEASRTGKGQFYHYFKNKEGLVHAVLQTHREAIEHGTARVKHDVKSWDDLERWFHDHIELQKRFKMTRGCPIGTIGNGVTDQDELIRADLCHIFDIVKSRLTLFFAREKAQGRLVSDAHEEALAEYCLAVVQGAMFQGKIRRSSEAAETVVREAMAHLRHYMQTK